MRTVVMYLDDLDPSQLTDEQKAEFQQMFEKDPYHFYNLWRDPDSAQRYFEGDDFQTTPASEVYLKLGALELAGAPRSVIDEWARILKNKGRPTEDHSDLPPKMRPIQEKLKKIDTLCRNINEQLNYAVDNVTPDPDDFPDEVPFALKWHQIMNKAMGAPDVEEHHEGVARHYKATDATLAHMGVEIVEVTVLADQIDIDLDSCTDSPFVQGSPFLAAGEEVEEILYPNGIRVIKQNGHVIVQLQYFDVYE